MNHISKFMLPSILEDILKELRTIGATPIVVGGSVRDFFLSIPIKDYDIEIFEIDSLDIIQKSLEKFGCVKSVGKSFGVLTLRVNEYDFDFTETLETVVDDVISCYSQTPKIVSRDTYFKYDRLSHNNI